MNEPRNAKASLIGYMQIVLTRLSEVISTARCWDVKTDEERCERVREGKIEMHTHIERGGCEARRRNIDVCLHTGRGGPSSRGVRSNEYKQ